MSNPNDGGPAFPQTDCNACGSSHRSTGHEEPGMTLRDYFAAHAPPMDDTWRSLYEPTTQPQAAKIRWALWWADAMLKAREKKP